MKLLLTIYFFSFTVFSSGQGKAEKELLHFLKTNEIDSFVLIKSGCANCKISYEEVVKLPDTVSIWLLYKKKGVQSFLQFSDIKNMEKFNYIETNILDIIHEKQDLLRLKDKYYEEQKLVKFQAPCLSVFPYERLQIQIGKFNHVHTVVKREEDECGTILTNEDWFKVELDILRMFDLLKKERIN